MRFIDEAVIEISSGDGGNGCLSFRREKFIPKGGPDGGDGGKGGNINFIANESLHTLQDFKLKRKYKAQNGRQGKGKNMHGKDGEDTILEVPLGTILINDETDELLCDLTKSNQTYTAVTGGKGGLGNARFKTSTNRAPRKTTEGKLGEIVKIRLELKVLADVGLLGKPNAGKSTFFNSIVKENRSIVSTKAGTTRDAISKSILFKNDNIQLFDTAGLRKKSKVNQEIEIFSVSKAISSMRSSSGILYLVDGKEKITDQDLHLISLIISAGKPLILGINKSDKLSQYDKSNLTRSINKKLAFISGISIHYISAKHNKGTAKVFKELIKLVKKSSKKVDTSSLNNFVEEASKLNPPQMSGRFRPKIKYANLLSSQPTIIRIQGNNLDKLTKQYQKYLENFLRKKLNFEGIPIKLVFKNNTNPFGEKKNKLTKKQLAKRKRIARR